MSLLEKASIITTPTAYGVGVLNSIKPAIPFGEELVTNGNFASNSDWTLGTGWTIANGQLVRESAVSGSYAQTSYDLGVIGKKYIISINVAEVTSGILYVYGGLGGTPAISITSSGVYTINHIWASDQPLGIFCNNSFVGKINNISVKEKTDADFDFTRTSSATRVNPDYLIETVSINSANLVQNGNFSELGSELVTNGDFETDSDWNLRSAWVISNGVCSLTPPNSDYLSQSNVFTANKFYKLSFEIVVNSGSLEPQFFDSGFQTIGTYSTTQTVVVYFESTSSGTLYFKSNSFDGSIDNVSVKQVDPNDRWVVGTGWSFGTNKIIHSSGTGSASRLTQTGFNNTSLYKLSLTMTNRGLNTYRIFNGAGSSVSLLEGTNTYLVSGLLVGQLIIEPNYHPGGDVEFSNISVIEIQENGVPRLDYTNGTASILLEPQSTNLYSNSNYNASTWTASNIDSVTSNYAISPDGTQNAFRVVMSSSGSLIYSGGTGSSGTNTVSVYAKSNTNTEQKFRFFGNGVTSVSADMTVNQEWQRFEFSAAFSFVTWGLKGASVSATNDILFFGFQHEVQSFSTSLIPTSGSTVTRAAETLTNAGNSDLINSTEGVLYAEIAALANDLTNRRISLVKDGNNKINLVLSTSSNTVQAIVISGGAVQFNQSFVISDTTEFNKIAIKYKVNDFALWIDGVEVATDTSGNTFSSGELTTLTFDNATGTNLFFGKCKTVAVFKEALSDTELACLTSTNNKEIFLNYYYRMQYVGANTEALSCAEQTFNV